ncbi:phosphate ABC transporter permease PstA [Ornithinimicrobium ciconiae]|uniref:Phosphate transport system permease protein PstA n=1 Tax=Ornithinimicrobium ciconiae TaxID=2594265 RepID=A0A516G9E3_9MICO|nr:phosphate ABC transporter permease PstA [Ornithinimicrobium ciconiae]
MNSVTRTATASARRTTQLNLENGARRGKWKGEVFRALLILCLVVAFVTLVAVIIQAAVKGWPRLDWNLIRQMPSTLDRESSGMQSALFGTIYLMIGLVLTVVPIGVSAAIYMEEFADQSKWWVRFIDLNIQNLAAVPSIVFGILGLALIVRGPLSLGTVVYAGSLTLAMLVLPTIILASREAIRSVPVTLRNGSLGLGATKWQTIWHQVLPSAVPGMVTGTILALSRAIGETAPLLLVGATVFVTYNPDGFFDGAYTALPVQIYQWASRPQEEFRILASAGVIVLLAVLLAMNSIAIWIRNKFTRDL